MAGVSYMECCGCRELSDLSDIERTTKGATEFLQEVKDQLTDEGHFDTTYNWKTHETIQGEWHDEVFHCPAFFIFTQHGDGTDVTARGGYGDYFTSFIVDEGLGTVHDTEPALNENSGNLIKVFTWTVNQPAFKAWTGIKAKKAKVA